MRRNNKEQVAKIAVFITSVFVIFLSVTYAFINVTLTGTKRQVITAGDLSLVLEEDENNLTIENALPMYDEVGKLQEAFTFRLVNNGTVDMGYTVKLIDITAGSDKLATSDVKYYLTKNGTGTPALLSTLSDGVVDSGTISGTQTIHYTLRLWIRDDITENNTISGKSLSYRIDVEATQEISEDNYRDESGANIPELASGMIPVTYDDTKKSWVKANTKEAWYDYNAQMWANAVTVTEESRSRYASASTGTPISMDDINTMWVWIPRYEYQYTDLGSGYAGGTQDLPGEIKINFIAANQTSPSNNDIYKIPEGFTFGGEELPGFWIGKFETTGTITEACTDENCTTADLNIKPNLSSVREQTVSSFFYGIRSMQNASNASKYGFDVIGTTTQDIHMTKNTEWGIVAMLSQSKYGKYGNSAYSGENKEVYQNKSNSYITGMSNGTSSQDATGTQVTYDTPNTGYGASTTGTIYGVYDMSGGTYEYVMGNYNNVSGSSDTVNSGFVGENGPSSGGAAWPEAKYYDLYASQSASNGYKPGDATYEVEKWYNDYFHDNSFIFVDPSNPWLLRGGNYDNGIEAGIFGNSTNGGNGYENNSVRISLKP